MATFDIRKAPVQIAAEFKKCVPNAIEKLLSNGAITALCHTKFPTSRTGTDIIGDSVTAHFGGSGHPENAFPSTRIREMNKYPTPEHAPSSVESRGCLNGDTHMQSNLYSVHPPIPGPKVLHDMRPQTLFHKSMMLSWIEESPTSDRTLVTEVLLRLQASNVAFMGLFYINVFTKLSEEACRSALRTWSYMTPVLSPSNGKVVYGPMKSHEC